MNDSSTYRISISSGIGGGETTIADLSDSGERTIQSSGGPPSSPANRATLSYEADHRDRTMALLLLMNSVLDLPRAMTRGLQH